MDEPARDGQRGREELLAKLSLEDKISLLTGADYWSLRRHSGIGLPATWPQSPDGLPATMPDEGVLAYTEGLHIGYRHFDRPGREPCYPFGHGLGYARWEYLAAEVVTPPPAGERVQKLSSVSGSGMPVPGRDVRRSRSTRPVGTARRTASAVAGHRLPESSAAEQTRKRWPTCSARQDTPLRTGQPDTETGSRWACGRATQWFMISLSGTSTGNAAKGSRQKTMSTRHRLSQPSAGSA